ncbi:unnamed protein product [Amoebophrya sp. A25]|nr:unnamed protein product [Amoebophrya sp. A25]|eukprot:GSA25T00017901001.1
MESRVQIELERSTDCASSQWHTRHDESRYDRYEDRFLECLSSAAQDMDYVYSCNPGPRAHGMHCKQSTYNPKLWHSMVKNERNQRWFPDVTFCYPRVGSFEVTVVKGKQRIPVFSKLTLRKWPHPEWLAKKVVETVETKLSGGWTPFVESSSSGATENAGASFGGKDNPRKYATAKLTDEALRKQIKKKFSTIIGAFRAFDKNGDGCISRAEFTRGLRSSGLDLPQDQVDKLWAMADEDGTGNLQYQEFARKFSTYKASHSLHRHADFRKDGGRDEKLVQSLHGVDAACRVQRRTSIRDSEASLEWGVDESQLADKPEEVLRRLTEHEAPSIPQISRDAEQMSLPAEQMSMDQIRAKIYKKHGNSLLNGFRHFDIDGSGTIDFEEFVKYLPRVLGESITETKLATLWRSFDPDLSGEIDMREFVSDRCMEGTHLQTFQGLQTFKGNAVDPTLAAVSSAKPTTGGPPKSSSTQLLNNVNVRQSEVTASKRPPAAATSAEVPSTNASTILGGGENTTSSASETEVMVVPRTASKPRVEYTKARQGTSPSESSSTGGELSGASPLESQSELEHTVVRQVPVLIS